MTPIDIHRVALGWATELFDMVAADLTPEQVRWTPPGNANPIGALCTHAICSTDAITNMVLGGGQPMFADTWRGRTGISEPQMILEFEWARRVQVDLQKSGAYATAVWSATDDYISSLSPPDLGREVDMSASGLGVRTVDWCLSALITSHINNMAGEISALKGVQGAKGYPF